MLLKQKSYDQCRRPRTFNTASKQSYYENVLLQNIQDLPNIRSNTWTNIKVIYTNYNNSHKKLLASQFHLDAFTW